MDIKGLIMCVRNWSNSVMYCLTNLVGRSRAQLVVFYFMTNLYTSSPETTSCHIYWELKNTIHSPGGMADTQFMTFDMANVFFFRNTRRLFISSRNRLLGSTADM